MNSIPTTEPLISVITPALNPCDLFGVVKSLNNQTFQNFEWVLVDDGSKPEAISVFECAISQASFGVKFIQLEKNCGQAEARNIGVKTARGKFIKFLDADDSLDSAHLEALLSASGNSLDPKSICFAPTQHIFTDRGTSFVNLAYPKIALDPQTQLVQMLVSPFMSHCGALFRRNLLSELGPYDSSLVTDEDGDLLFRILLEGYYFTPVPTVNYLYRHHDQENRVSCNDSREKLEARKRVCVKLIESYQRKGGTLPLDIKRAMCKKLDKIALANWTGHKDFCRDLLSLAEMLLPGYPRSGSFLERLFRLFFGVELTTRALLVYRTTRYFVTGKRI